MQQIFIRQEDIIDNRIRVIGEDANHLGKVLRMKAGEKLRVSTDTEKNYLCEVSGFKADAVELTILEEADNTEPSVSMTLYQAIPKGDRMETVIEKAVELGISRIIPMEMKFCVVKLDDRKKANRLQRWQKIAETAARQSKRSKVPEVGPVMTFREVLLDMEGQDLNLVPYENALGMRYTKEVLESIEPGMSVAMLVGPEGGFAPEEIEAAGDKGKIISLGKRILRTDTAAIMMAGLVMMQSEYAED